MSWKKRIPCCFGAVDKKFARHANDCERASEMLAEANKENIGWKEYLEKIEDWLKEQGCNANHIKEEMERVKDLRNYLKYD